MRKLMTTVFVVLSTVTFAFAADNLIQIAFKDCYSNSWSNNDYVDRYKCLQSYIQKQPLVHGTMDLYRIHEGLSLLDLKYKLSPDTVYKIKNEIQKVLLKTAINNMMTNNRLKRSVRQRYIGFPRGYRQDYDSMRANRFLVKNIPSDLHNAPAPIIKYPFAKAEDLIDNRTRTSRKGRPKSQIKPSSLRALNQSSSPEFKRKFKESKSLTDTRPRPHQKGRPKSLTKSPSPLLARKFKESKSLTDPRTIK